MAAVPTHPIRPSRFIPEAKRFRIRTLVLVGAVALFAGCQQVTQTAKDWTGGPYFAATNFSGLQTMPAEVRRVAVMPLAGMDAVPVAAAASVAEQMRAALLSSGRFEAVFVSSELTQELSGMPAVRSTDPLPAGLFERLVRDHAIDAVLFVDMTAFQPYPPLRLGVRAKLARCDSRQTVFWAFDTVYDAHLAPVANSARRYAAGGRSDATDTSVGVLQSPSRFAGYVFSDVFRTLPRRPAPLPQPPASQ